MSTTTSPHVHPPINLGEDPLSTIVGILRDLSEELETLTERVSVLESRARHVA